MAVSSSCNKLQMDNGKYVRYTPEQVEALERLYHDCPKPSSMRRQQLIRECPILSNIEPKQIKVWFQNRRYHLLLMCCAKLQLSFAQDYTLFFLVVNFLNMHCYFIMFFFGSSMDCQELQNSPQISKMVAKSYYLSHIPQKWELCAISTIYFRPCVWLLWKLKTSKRKSINFSNLSVYVWAISFDFSSRTIINLYRTN